MQLLLLTFFTSMRRPNAKTLHLLIINIEQYRTKALMAKGSLNTSRSFSCDCLKSDLDNQNMNAWINRPTKNHDEIN